MEGFPLFWNKEWNWYNIAHIIQENIVDLKYITELSGPGVDLEPIFVLSG